MMEYLQGLTNEQLIVYAIVFAAVFLPIAFWRREKVVSYDIAIVDWRRLPVIFKVLWRPVFLFETTLGASLVSIFPRRSKRYVELIEISSLPLTPRSLFACKAILALLFCLIGALTYLLPPFANGFGQPATVVILTACGWLLPSVAVDSAAQKRQEEIVRSLPFAIDLMGSAMRAGLEFGAAMRYYANLGIGGALEEEFARVAREATLGKPVAESLQDMAARVRIKTFTAFAGVIAYGTEIGASIADTLRIHGAEMRRERFSIAEQKAARAPSVMIFPLAVFILPAVFLIIFVPVLLQFIATQG